jgi:hypothetical protein
VGQSAFDDPTRQVKSVAGAPVNAGPALCCQKRSSPQHHGTLEIEPLEAQENNMAENKKSGALTTVLTYDDVRSVSPALEH